MSFRTFVDVINPDYWYKIRSSKRYTDKQKVIEELQKIITFDEDVFFEIPCDFLTEYFNRDYLIDLLKEILIDFNKSRTYAIFRLVSDDINGEIVDYIELYTVHKK